MAQRAACRQSCGTNRADEHRALTNCRWVTTPAVVRRSSGSPASHLRTGKRRDLARLEVATEPNRAPRRDGTAHCFGQAMSPHGPRLLVAAFWPVTSEPISRERLGFAVAGPGRVGQRRCEEDVRVGLATTLSHDGTEGPVGAEVGRAEPLLAGANDGAGREAGGKPRCGHNPDLTCTRVIPVGARASNGLILPPTHRDDRSPRLVRDQLDLIAARIVAVDADTPSMSTEPSDWA